MMVGEAKDRRSSQVVIPSTARMKVHGRVDGGKSHGGDLTDDTRTTDREKAEGSGALATDGTGQY